MGNTTGKLKIAIKVALLLALAAMEEINVNAMEKPKLPKKSTNKKSQGSFTGLPATNPYTPNAIRVKTNNKTVLYAILANNKVTGLTN